MIKDIPQHKVEEMAMAIVPREEGNYEEDDFWDVYVLNLKNAPIENVLINSRGYGEMNGEQMKTTVFRHFFEQIAASTAQHVEPIQIKLFDIANEFWVSFTFDGYMYDKKYVFVKGSITEDNLTYIPLLGCRGVMIK